MRKMFIRSVLASAAVAAMSIPAAHSAYTVTIEQDGANVDATGSGTIDLTDLVRSPIISTTVASVDGVAGLEFTGPAQSSLPMGYVTGYFGATGPATFGTATGAGANSGAGDLVGVITSGNSSFVVVYVYPGYISGSGLETSSTYDNQTLASLGLTPGVYTYTWGTGAHADSYTIDIGDSVGAASAPVPEASTWAMMAIGFAGLGAGALLRDRRARLSSI